LGFDVSHQRTSRHSMNFGAGVSILRTVERNTGVGPDYDVGLTGQLGFLYELADMRVGFDLTQDIEPSAIGSLQTFTRLGAQFSQDVNERERFGATLAAARRAPVSGPGDTRDTLTISPQYTWRINKETDVSVGYSFRLSRDSDEGTATGHMLFFNVGTDFSLFD
ncbi:MAG: hypothetical protein AAFU55_06760, partial [Pseudomonadota bacterium]